MELILNIIQIIVLVVMITALWQAWQIIKQGKDNEKLSENEVKAFTCRLNITAVCFGINVVIMVCRFFLTHF